MTSLQSLNQPSDLFETILAEAQEVAAPGLAADAFHATAALSKDRQSLTVIAFNTAKMALTCALQVGQVQAFITIPTKALQILRSR